MKYKVIREFANSKFNLLFPLNNEIEVGPEDLNNNNFNAVMIKSFPDHFKEINETKKESNIKGYIIRKIFPTTYKFLKVGYIIPNKLPWSEMAKGNEEFIKPIYYSLNKDTKEIYNKDIKKYFKETKELISSKLEEDINDVIKSVMDNNHIPNTNPIEDLLNLIKEEYKPPLFREERGIMGPFGTSIVYPSNNIVEYDKNSESVTITLNDKSSKPIGPNTHEKFREFFKKLHK